MAKTNKSKKDIEKRLNFNELPLSTKSDIQGITNEVIDNLSKEAILELNGGNDKDLDRLISDVNWAVQEITCNGNVHVNDFQNLSAFEASFDETMKIQSYNYFKTTMLPNFNQYWRNIEFGNLIQIHKYLCIIACRGIGKCLSPDTEVVMYDGSIKMIQDIQVGDKLMGKDNTPRTVLSLHSGEDDMYEVEQKMFKNYTVNSKHDIYFKRWKTLYKNGRSKRVYDESIADEIKMTPIEFIGQSKCYHRDVFGVGINGWDLPKQNLLIDPYFVGYWIGDGNHAKTEICTIDKEIVDYLYQYAEELGLEIWHPEESIVYQFVSPSWMKPHEGSNVLLNRMRKYNLMFNKHIPDIFLRSSRKQRLGLLAGIVDSDGHNPKDKKNSIIISQQREGVTYQIQKLCWSLGFRCNVVRHEYKTKFKKTGSSYIHNIHISGDLSQIPCKIDRKKVTHTYSESKSPQRRGINVSYKGRGKYYGFTCDKDHLFILSDGTVVSNSYETAYSFPIWRLWRYCPPKPFQVNPRDNKNSRETMIITNESTLGKKHIAEIVTEINTNDLLKEKLNPNGRASLGKEGVISETGSLVKTRTYGSSGIRGNHVGALVFDDFLDESALYSHEQREKFKEIFFGSMMPAVEPDGYFVGSATPFSTNDIYSDLKKDKRFKVFEYPAIYPDGRILAPDRFSYKDIMSLKESLGTLRWSREIMITPVSDDATIFPWEYLRRAFRGMETITYVENIDSFPIKLERVVQGCDFAKSGSASADFTVFTVWGIDSNENYYLLYIWRKKGASHNEQVNKIIQINDSFRCNEVVVEVNGFQGILKDMLDQRGVVNVIPVITGQNKKHLEIGLPSLAVMFERGEIRMPYGDEYSRETSDTICSEFNSMVFNQDKGTFEAASGHDDTCMSSFFAINELRQNKSGFSIDLI